MAKESDSFRTWNPGGQLYDWLAQADQLCAADLIFSLAGRDTRKLYALQLFQKEVAPKVVFSTGRFEIRRFACVSAAGAQQLRSVAEPVPPPKRHFFVSFDGQRWQIDRIPVGHWGTLEEITALARWLRERPAIRSVLVVTSGMHLRRVGMCCRALLPHGVDIRLAETPDDGPWLNRGRWWQERKARNLVLAELLKIPCYRLLLLRHESKPE